MITITEKDNKIYLPLSMIKGMGPETSKLIIENREKYGPYSSFLHFMATTSLIKQFGLSSVELLIKSNALRNFGYNQKTLLNEYCEWLFPILQTMYKKMDLSSYTAFEARLFGRVSERLFNVWLHHKNISPREVTFMYMEKVNLWKKGMGFLMAKLFGKKYDKSF